eukprot:s2109_g11.t1
MGSGKNEIALWTGSCEPWNTEKVKHLHCAVSQTSKHHRPNRPHRHHSDESQCSRLTSETCPRTLWRYRIHENHESSESCDDLLQLACLKRKGQGKSGKFRISLFLDSRQRNTEPP